MIIPIYLAHIIPFISYHTIMIKTEAYKKHLEEIKKNNTKEVVSPLLSNKKKKEVATMSVKSVSKKEAKKKAKKKEEFVFVEKWVKYWKEVIKNKDIR